MQSSLFIGATGLKTHSSGMHTLSNNLANVSTVAYKQQSILFEDLMYQSQPSMGSAWPQVNNQTGMGAQTGAVRTLFSVQGAFEPGSAVTDMALSGRGFFEVSNGEKTHYTRAGNFRFTKDGFLNDPNGFTLTGVKVVNGVEQGGIGPIQIDWTDSGIIQSKPKQTTAVSTFFNLGFTDDKSSGDPLNPAFNLLSAWDGTQDVPLDSGKYGYVQPIKLYDDTGKSINANIYIDGTSLGTGGKKIYEYIVTVPPGDDGGPAAGTAGAGLLMAGTLSFSEAGELYDMSAFSPSGSDYKNLANWTPSSLAGGLGQVNLRTSDGKALNFSLNMGIAAKGGWENAPANAAAVGADPTKISSMGSGVTTEPMASTALGTSSNVKRYSQDGYGIGSMNDMTVTRDGEVVASYTNGQSEVLYKIPVFRFTSEDGLYHEGMNHYSYTDACGKMEYGTAGTENYGKILASTLETSNVDMAREMTMMIIMQRGFQMNSKTITTSDAMLQKALELKR